jgi:uncharacterized membrane protein
MNQMPGSHKNQTESVQKDSSIVRKLRLSASVTTILGILSVIAIIFLFLALADIAHMEEDLSLEWHVAGVCIIVISTFIISTFVTISMLFKTHGFNNK